MKCDRCYDKTLCRQIDFDPLNDRILYLCNDCSRWVYAYLINEVFILTPPTSDEDEDEEEDKNENLIVEQKCYDCDKYFDSKDMHGDKCMHCHYHDWYGKHYR